MKLMMKSVAVVLSIVVWVGFCGCAVFDGTETSLDSETAVTAEETGTVQAEADRAPAPVAQSQTVAVQERSTAEVFEPVVVTEEDKAAKIDKFIGNWVDVSDNTRYCLIKKTEIGYSYTDNESTFPAEVKDGVLMIHIEIEDDYAKGIVDEAAGTLTITYQDQAAVFKKKQE